MRQGRQINITLISVYQPGEGIMPPFWEATATIADTDRIFSGKGASVTTARANALERLLAWAVRQEQAEEEARPVAIVINGHSIEVERGSLTGTQIRAAALAAGVRIREDDLLYKYGAKRHLQLITDEAVVEMRDGMEFRSAPVLCGKGG